MKKKQKNETTLLQDLEDIVSQFQSDKITEEQVIEILSNIIRSENK